MPCSSSPASIRRRSPPVLAPTMRDIMPTARDTRRGAPLFPAPPADAPDASPSWLRWLGFNLWLFACVIVAVALALLALSELGARRRRRPADRGLRLDVPVPAVHVAAVHGRARLLRAPLHAIRAAGPSRCTPLLFALFPYAVVTFVAPGIAASWIAYFIYGAIVRLPPLMPPASGATSR